MTANSEEMTTQEFIQRLLAPERAQRVDTFAVFTFSEWELLVPDRKSAGRTPAGPVVAIPAG